MIEETLTTPIHKVVDTTQIWRKMKMTIDGRGPKMEKIRASRVIAKILQSRKKCERTLISVVTFYTKKYLVNFFPFMFITSFLPGGLEETNFDTKKRFNMMHCYIETSE